ncbi:MAG: TIGR00282 family metallophosphoesterase [Deferribacterales bacterium]
MQDNSRKHLNIIFLGDIVGRLGRNLLKEHLTEMRCQLNADLIFVNGENASSGFGITKKNYEELISLGIDGVTSGNHVWDKKGLEKDIQLCDRLIRPYNFPPEQPGQGYLILEIYGVKVALLNLIGRVFMGNVIDCPFRSFDRFYNSMETDLIIVDFHAEATSEKVAFGNYVDGRATAVVGTHTHVQTNDDRILPKGTFYITDLGMCGSLDSVIGIKSEIAIKKLLTGMPEKFDVELEGRGIINGVFLQCDLESGKIIDYKKIYRIVGV